MLEKSSVVYVSMNFVHVVYSLVKMQNKCRKPFAFFPSVMFWKCDWGM